MSAYYGESIDKDHPFKLLTYAADRGVTFWDTAMMYGSSEYRGCHRLPGLGH